MRDIKELDLKTENNRRLIYDDSRLIELEDELEDFLDDSDMDYMKNKGFARKVLVSREIKANNEIEDYNDDLDEILKYIKNINGIDLKDNKQRIINVYKAYLYILRNKILTNSINKNSLKKLYSILSNGLLDEYDLSHMGKFYRDDDVYIFRTDRLCGIDDKSVDKGMDPKKLDSYMDNLFEFIKDNSNKDTDTENFIISQIAHFYLVYVHPYFDVNGRTARTTALWHLINSKAYPYIIFNRAISFQKNTYHKVIQESKEFYNLTFFLKYMLLNVKKELEKEYIMNTLANNTSSHLTVKDYQTMEYLLSMNGNITVKDYANFYRRFNDKKKAIDIYYEDILPLLDKGVIKEVRKTNGYITGDLHNIELGINENRLDIDRSKIKRFDSSLIKR